MPRRPTTLQSEFPYHIFARCINRQWFDVPKEELWEIISDYLYMLHHGFKFQIHAFVLMDNHYHSLVFTPDANLDRGMNYFQREVSRRISARANRINQTFGGPYKWCVVDSYNYFLNAYKYVYRNPVEAGLARHCEEYRYSTLNGLVGNRRLTIPVAEDTILFDPHFRPDALNWLNRGKKKDFVEVGKALNKRVFRYRKCNTTGLYIRKEDFVF